MGAVSISKVVDKEKGKMISFLDLMEYQTNDPYSGDWNTVHRIKKTVKVFDKASDANTKKFNETKKYRKMVDDAWDSLMKGEAIVFDLGVVGYEVRSLKKVKKAGSKPKYENQYVVYNEIGNKVKTFKTAKDAEQYAMSYAITNNQSTYTKKQNILVSGEEQKTFFNIQKVMKKSMPKTVKTGTKVAEIHKYYIIGMAAC